MRPTRLEKINRSVKKDQIDLSKEVTVEKGYTNNSEQLRKPISSPRHEQSQSPRSSLPRDNI